MIVESKAMRKRCEKYCREFSGDERKSVQWKAYLKKNGIEADCPNEFKVIVDCIASKVCPLLPESESK
jgi:hypothetical protein